MVTGQPPGHGVAQAGSSLSGPPGHPGPALFNYATITKISQYFDESATIMPKRNSSGHRVLVLQASLASVGHRGIQHFSLTPPSLIDTILG